MYVSILRDFEFQRNLHFQFLPFWIQILLKFLENSVKIFNKLWNSTLKNRYQLWHLRFDSFFILKYHGFTGLRVLEQILKLFECQSVLLKILRLYVKKNPVKLIPYWWNKYLKVEKIDHGAPLQVFGWVFLYSCFEAEGRYGTNRRLKR